MFHPFDLSINNIAYSSYLPVDDDRRQHRHLSRHNWQVAMTYSGWFCVNAMMDASIDKVAKLKWNEMNEWEQSIELMSV